MRDKPMYEPSNSKMVPTRNTPKVVQPEPSSFKSAKSSKPSVREAMSKNIPIERKDSKKDSQTSILHTSGQIPSNKSALDRL
jgi:hypothetical protein